LHENNKDFAEERVKRESSFEMDPRDGMFDSVGKS